MRLSKYETKVQGKLQEYKLFRKDILRNILSSTDVELISATVGTTDLQKPYAVHFIESSYIHEGYDNNNSWINDIALLKVVLVKLKNRRRQ